MRLSPAQSRAKGNEALAHLLSGRGGSWDLGFEVGLTFSGMPGTRPEITSGSASEFGLSLGKLN